MNLLAVSPLTNQLFVATLTSLISLPLHNTGDIVDIKSLKVIKQIPGEVID